MRVILADPFLVEKSGHCWSYLHCLEQELKGLNVKVEIAGNSALDQALLPRTAIPHFSPQFVGLQEKTFRGRLKNLFPSRNTLLDDLRALSKKLDISKEDVLLLNSLRPDHLCGLAKWLSSQSEESTPWVVAINHYTMYQDGLDSAEITNRCRYSWLPLAETAKGRRVLLGADTEQLVDEVEAITGLPVLLVPVPHTMTAEEPARGHRTLHIGYLGEARPDKGFDQLPALAANLSPLLVADALQMTVQASRPRHLDRSYAAEIESLRASGCQIIDAALSETEYNELLDALDVVILPYSGKHYQRQTSGVFVEARCMGKIAVVPSGTWMASKLLQNTGGVVYDASSVGALLSAVRLVVRDYQKLRKDAHSVGATWRSEHNSRRLLQKIFAEISSRDPRFQIP
jgi:glycosyltransferase involved in cell wall biosynthesis